MTRDPSIAKEIYQLQRRIKCLEEADILKTEMAHDDDWKNWFENYEEVISPSHLLKRLKEIYGEDVR